MDQTIRITADQLEGMPERKQRSSSSSSLSASKFVPSKKEWHDKYKHLPQDEEMHDQLMQTDLQYDPHEDRNRDEIGKTRYEFEKSCQYEITLGVYLGVVSEVMPANWKRKMDDTLASSLNKLRSESGKDAFEQKWDPTIHFVSIPEYFEAPTARYYGVCKTTLVIGADVEKLIRNLPKQMMVWCLGRYLRIVPDESVLERSFSAQNPNITTPNAISYSRVKNSGVKMVLDKREMVYVSDFLTIEGEQESSAFNTTVKNMIQNSYAELEQYRNTNSAKIFLACEKAFTTHMLYLAQP